MTTLEISVPQDNPADMQARRNATEAADLKSLRESKTSRDITAHLLTVRLRYVFPEFPTEMETLLIPAFRTAFPELIADFDKYQAMPSGCSCAGRLGSAFSLNPLKVQDVLDKVFGGRVFKFISAPVTSQVNLIGSTAIIDATPQAWQRYFTELIRQRGGNAATLKNMYNGVQIKEMDGNQKWLLLFY